MARMIAIAICRRCWDTYSSVPGADMEASEGETPCPTDLSGPHYGAKRTSPPPEWCPYALEHAVAVSLPRGVVVD